MMLATLLLLAWRPLLEPLPVDRYWLLTLVPLVLGISLVYKAIRMDDLRALPGQALWLTGQVLAFLALGAALLWLMSEVL